MPKLKPLINWDPSRYDALSSNYDRYASWFFPIGEIGQYRVLDDLEPGPILDIACGTGTLLKMAGEKGCQTTGVDTSWGMLQEARRKIPGADMVQASFYALPFKRNYFEYVVETNSVSGVDINAGEVLSEMVRVCKSGGEIRLGDYGSAGRKGWWFRFMEILGILFGDCPNNYRELFKAIGYEAEIEKLGWGGMYQFIRVVV